MANKQHTQKYKFTHEAGRGHKSKNKKTECTENVGFTSRKQIAAKTYICKTHIQQNNHQKEAKYTVENSS